MDAVSHYIYQLLRNTINAKNSDELEISRHDEDVFMFASYWKNVVSDEFQISLTYRLSDHTREDLHPYYMHQMKLIMYMTLLSTGKIPMSRFADFMYTDNTSYVLVPPHKVFTNIHANTGMTVTVFIDDVE